MARNRGIKIVTGMKKSDVVDAMVAMDDMEAKQKAAEEASKAAEKTAEKPAEVKEGSKGSTKGRRDSFHTYRRTGDQHGGTVVRGVQSCS